jgi:hypothetical protein
MGAWFACATPDPARRRLLPGSWLVLSQLIITHLVIVYLLMRGWLLLYKLYDARTQKGGS